MTIEERIAAGEFTSKIEVGPPPPKPAVLRKSAGDLTEAEIQSLPAVKAEYDRVCAAHKARRAAGNADGARLIQAFWAAVYEECGVPDGTNPFVAQMQSIAYEEGHSNGYTDIYLAFDRLMPLWVLADAAVKKGAW